MKIKMKPLKWLLVLFAIVGVFPSACTSNGPVASQTNATMTPEIMAASVTLTLLSEFSCPPTFPTSVNGTSQVLLIDEAPQNCFATDAAQITDVALEGNILKINITYRGGCQEHTFGLYGETAFLQSNPPHWSLYLSNDAQGDTCTENMEKLLVV